MGSQAKRNRIHLPRAAALALLAGTVAGCSSNFTRFDQSLYTGSIDQKTAPATPANPYPGDVDATTTSSVGAQRYGPTPYPVNNVSPRPVSPDDHGAAYQNQQMGYNTPPAQPNQPANQQVRRAALAAPTVIRAPQTGSATNPGTDNVTTSSIIPARIPAQRRQPTPPTGQRGWTGSNGTTVTIGPGETLYNLSKRYGVPVSAILKANDMSDPSHVEVGQQIVIPTYVYGDNVPVSAPDSDAKTRYASASRGALYAPASGRVPVPQRSPMMASAGRPAHNQQVAALGKPRAAAQQPAARNQPSSGHQAAWQRRYKVKQGDTLSRIAATHNVHVADLRAANNLSSSEIRIGQELVIPSGEQRVAANAPQGVDPIVTGSSNKPTGNADRNGRQAKSVVTENQLASANVSAPAQTGIGEFRWPVRGRVIASFGDKIESGRNDGIDISVPEGTAVKAAENGVVVYAGSELEGFGNLILIRHSGGWVSAYAYNKTLSVKRGDEVRRGQVIARSGKSGDAEMPKLHFELRKNSVPVDPLKHLGAA